MEGMTFKQSPYGKIRALYRTKTGNGDIRISGACWRKTTAMLKMRRYRYLIEPDQHDERKDQDLPEDSCDSLILLLFHQILSV
jgi:hypothetical protein